MKVALFTGMRRMEILRLKWIDLNFEAGFISIRGPKGGEDQKIPMNETAREIFKSVVKTGSEYIFPGYAHLRDEALKAGAGQIDEIMKQSSARLFPTTNEKIV